MKKIYQEVMYWLITGSLVYMIYTGDYSYLNILDIIYTLLLLYLTIFLPFAFISLNKGKGKKVEEIRGHFKKDITKESLLSDVWTYSKSVFSITLLTLSGHFFILVWYIVATVMAILFKEWVLKQDW